MVVSYAAQLATEHGNHFRAVVTSDIFKYMFPNFQIVKNTEADLVTTAGGCRIATTIDGSVTGRGCDIAIVDDPSQPDDALSEVRRERAKDFFFQTLLSRLNDPRTAAIIVVMQRLHQDDLAGTLLRSSDEWFNLKLPAIATSNESVLIGPQTSYERLEGEALHPERMSLDDLERRRQEIGSDTWQAQYQQEPVPPGGFMVRRDWVRRRYDTLPARTSSSRVIQSVDTAIKAGPRNDYTAITTWFLQDNCYWLIDVARKRLEYPELKAFVLENAHKHNPNKILIEDAGTGSALIQELRYLPFAAVAVRPVVDKLTRMQIAAAKFESGKVFLPRNAPWLAVLEAELFSYPQSRHDDQIDSISQALNEKMTFYDPNAIADALGRIAENLWWQQRWQRHLGF
jgi:predicted phage terminase large subunit-like protein